MTNQHDARTDTYACALIFCELLKKMDPSGKLRKLDNSKGYKRIRSMDFDTTTLDHAVTTISDSDEGEGAAQSSPKKRRKNRSNKTNANKSTQTDTHGNGGVHAETQTHKEDTSRERPSAEEWVQMEKPRKWLKDMPKPGDPRDANICHLLRELKIYCI